MKIKFVIGKIVDVKETISFNGIEHVVCNVDFGAVTAVVYMVKNDEVIAEGDIIYSKDIGLANSIYDKYKLVVVLNEWKHATGKYTPMRFINVEIVGRICKSHKTTLRTVGKSNLVFLPCTLEFESYGVNTGAFLVNFNDNAKFIEGISNKQEVKVLARLKNGRADNALELNTTSISLVD